MAQARRFTFVDIGANVGLFSLFVSILCGAEGAHSRHRAGAGKHSPMDFNVCANPGVPITIIPKALSDEAGVVAVELDRRDRGGTRTMKIDQAQPPAETVRVPSQTLSDVLAGEGVDAVDALKIDVEGLEDVILAPFFRDAPPQLWPRLLIIEDLRPSWKVDLMSVMQGCGYELVALSRHKNLMLRLKP